MPQHIDVPGMGVVEFPDGMSDDAISAAIKQNMPARGLKAAQAAQGASAEPPRGAVGDFVQSIPRGILGGLSSALSATGQSAMAEGAADPSMVRDIPSPHDTQAILEKNITGELPKPQGRAGRVGAAIGEGLGNPVSYVGPGGLPLKVGGAVLSSAASEGAGQATEGTAAEKPARVIAGLLGGVAAAKSLGPSAERAAVPTARELKDAAGKGYDAALNSGLVLDPKGVGSWATNVEQHLNGKGFTGGSNGTAPKTMAVLADLQNAPAGATVGAPNIDAVRKTLGNIAQETRPSAGGAILPTADANAASRALERLKTYTENIPQNHILAGNASDYVRNTKEANANWAAGSRTQDFDTRLTKAERTTDRQVAGSLDSQIKAKAGQVLDRGARGLNAEEKAQLELINSGSATSNVLRQIGRAGAGVIPMMMHAGTAMATGGSSIPAQLAVGGSLYGARKIAEAMTKHRAADLVEMLAKRSPEYERRVAALKPVDNSPNKAAVLRALMGQLGP